MGLFDFHLRSFFSQILPTLSIDIEVIFSLRTYIRSIANGFGAQVGAWLLWLTVTVFCSMFLDVIHNFLTYVFSHIQPIVSFAYLGTLLKLSLFVFFWVPISNITAILCQTLVYGIIMKPLVHRRYDSSISILKELINGFEIFLNSLIKNISSLVAIGVYFTKFHVIYLAMIAMAVLFLFLLDLFLFHDYFLYILISLLIMIVILVYANSRINTSLLVYTLGQIRSNEIASNISSNSLESTMLTVQFNRSDLDHCFERAYKDFIGNYFINFILLVLLQFFGVIFIIFLVVSLFLNFIFQPLLVVSFLLYYERFKKT
ncbi:MAG: hypothetical protein N3E37_01110 [Candidatus Micrarchaeota archaeon]|nr:hypothetical protein [Candidatus Micrarchaeota archaeon]